MRLALAAEAYRTGTVRLARHSLAGFAHLAATRHGLFAVNARERQLIAHGLFYGVTVRDDVIYAFEACDRPRNRTHFGRIVRFFRDGDGIVATDVFADGLDNGCHQIDFIGDRLAVVDTYNQCVLLYPASGGAPERHRPIPCEGEDWDRGFAHINSLIGRGGDILLLLHNGAEHTGRQSEIAVLDPNWHARRRTAIDGLGCHNLAILEDGTLLSCGSLGGELIGSNGLKRKVCDLMTRGLSVDDTRILVGGSAFSERALRDDAGGAIYFLDRDYRLRATLPMPAPVMEIRRIDGRDRSLSNFVG